MPLMFSVVLFLAGSLGFVAIGLLTYLLSASRPEIRFILSVFTLVIAALVAFTPLFLTAIDPNAKATLKIKVQHMSSRGSGNITSQTD